MNLLITGAWKCSEAELDAISSLGHTVYFMQDERAELPISSDIIDGVICNGLFLYHPIEKFTSLSYIQLTSAGLDRVPIEYIREKKIQLYNARGVYSVPMAEYALWGVLSIYKNAKGFFENQNNHRWEKIRTISELSGKTALVVGCGNVGGECAVRFGAMGCRVIGVDEHVREDVSYEKIYPVTSLIDAVKSADVMVLTLPYTERTHHLIDEAVLAEMKDGAILVNISRGGIVNTEALVGSLLSGKLSGAVLDVFEEEPLSESSQLWDMENVIITPHNSFVGEGNPQRLSQTIINNLKKRKTQI